MSERSISSASRVREVKRDVSDDASQSAGDAGSGRVPFHRPEMSDPPSTHGSAANSLERRQAEDKSAKGAGRQQPSVQPGVTSALPEGKASDVHVESKSPESQVDPGAQHFSPAVMLVADSFDRLGVTDPTEGMLLLTRSIAEDEHGVILDMGAMGWDRSVVHRDPDAAADLIKALCSIQSEKGEPVSLVILPPGSPAGLVHAAVVHVGSNVVKSDQAIMVASAARLRSESAAAGR